MPRIFVLPAQALLLVAFVMAAGARAQDTLLSDLYGSGVHNYYERDYFQAMENLSAAIDGGSQDPRPYYYRALTHLKQGDTWAAQADMQVGAAMESADVNGAYPVGKSLERIQGADRRLLEKYRAKARAEARQRQLTRDSLRYEQLRRNEADVLRRAPVGPAPAPLIPPPPAPGPAAKPGPAAPPAPGPADEDPFDKPAAEEPAAEEPAEEMPAEEPAEEEPAEEMPADEPAAEEKDPFGDEAKPEN